MGTPKPNTALILKEIITEKEKFKTVLRLATSVDNKEYKNSIITFMKIDEKEWNRLLRNKRVLYKKNNGVTICIEYKRGYLRWRNSSDPHADGLTGENREMQEKRTPAK